MRLLATIPYFAPAMQAGGPTQSMMNLVEALSGTSVELFVLCGNTDLDGSKLKVKENSWTDFNGLAKVFYLPQDKQNKEEIFSLLNELKPDIVFINGIYSIPFTMLPLLWNGKNTRKIVSVRGMLHPGALSQKRMKKKLYLLAYRMRRLHRKYEFHATGKEEQQFIYDVMGRGSNVSVVPNLPRRISLNGCLKKEEGKLNLVSIALISPMKNIKLVIEALKDCKGAINYDIYGPVKDKAYFDDCIHAIATLPSNVSVNYKGVLEADKVEGVLKNYHCFILPSKSENFGHAIYEALAMGKPVITSRFTPWNDLQTKKAGINVDIAAIAAITKAADWFTEMNDAVYGEWSTGAKKEAGRAIDVQQITKQYLELFGIHEAMPENLEKVTDVL
jgi:glycosyltransferase involved in cell wall biosynthesis